MKTAADVKRIYGIVGDSRNGFTDALRRHGKIEWVHVRHEEVAAFAAGAEARSPAALRSAAITVEMAKGFPLYMMKAVMSGRGDEIIDLTKSNLWR